MTKNLNSIALLGTSADPPTLGHQALLKGLITLFPRVATWASNNPTKNHGAPLLKRQKLLKALVDDIGDPGLELVPELSNQKTILTLETAAKLWPNTELVFIIGSDLASQIPSWFQAEVLLRKTRLGIAPRKGWPLNQEHVNTLESLGGQVELLPLNIPATSSSKLRTKPKIAQIPKAILPILLKHNLYGLSKEIL